MVDENAPLLRSSSASEDKAKIGNEVANKKPTGVGLWFFLVAMLGAFLAFVDDSFMISTHGEIASQFNQLSLGPWLVAAYNLGYATALPMYGRVCDMYGYRNALLSAYLLFTIGCVVAGGATSIWIIMVGRFLSGTGGAGMVDLISVILNDMESLREIAMLRSYMSIVTTLGVSIGAPLGGLLTDWIGWRWSFLIQAPFSLFCFGFNFWTFRPASKEELAGPNDVRPDLHTRSLNIVGLLLLAGTLTALMVLFQLVGAEELDVTAIVITTVLFACLAILYGINENFLTSDPLTPLQLFTSNKVGFMYLIQFLVQFAYFGLVSNISDFWIRTQNISNGLAGTFVIPVAVGAIVGATLQGQSIRRTGRYKTVSLISWIIAVVGYLLILIRWPQTPNLWENIYAFVASVGICALLVGQFVGLSAVLPQDARAMTMTIFFMAQQLGIAFGVTITTTVSRKILQNCLISEADGVNNILEEIHNILSNNRYAVSLPKLAQTIVKNCFLQGFRAIPILGLSTLVLVLPIQFYLPENSLDPQEPE